VGALAFMLLKMRICNSTTFYNYYFLQITSSGCLHFHQGMPAFLDGRHIAVINNHAKFGLHEKL
jgi:hypothetical protein